MKRGGPLKRYKGLRSKGQSETAQVKDRIQALIRQHVIKRDGGCFLRFFQDELPYRYENCGPTKIDGSIILQAEHLVTRANSISFADLRNIVCICQRHHIHFKPQHSRLYWELVERYLGPTIFNQVLAFEADYVAHRTTPMRLHDWRKVEAELQLTL